jgi:hypothetical protein
LKKDRKFLRQCVFCREYKNKEELIRITKNFLTGEIKINNNSEIQGRSVYLCKNVNCLENALKKKKIEHFLKSNVPESLKEQLYTVLNS